MRTRSVTSLVLPLLVLGAALAMLGGCRLFEPEVAEPPGTGSSILTNFSEPESTLATVSRAFAARVSGADTYLDCLANTDELGFSAVFDPAVLATFTGQPPSGWDISYERAFYDHFDDKFSGRDSLAWREIDDDPDPDPDPNQPDRRVLNRKYEAWEIKRSTDGTVTHRRMAVGYATLTFARAAGRWVILVWNDRVDPTVGVNPLEDDDRTFSWRRLESTGGS